MPRLSRIDAPGSLHHVIVRGIGRRKIFNDDRDRKLFIERLGGVLMETQTFCCAWALIPNHFHLLLRTGKVPLSSVMRRLLTGYVVTYNRRHKRYGHLFQNRYKTILCQEEPYFLELVRYIHLNPLRAKIVAELSQLDKYPFSGHSYVMGKRSNEWQSVKAVLQRFGPRVMSARRRYYDFVAQGIEQGKRPDLIGGGLIRSMGGWSVVKKLRQEKVHMKGDERILGDSDFVNQILSKAEEDFQRHYKLKAMGIDLDMVAQRVADIVGLEVQDVWTAGKYRKIVQARSLLCYWAVRELGESMTSMARRLNLSVPAISKSVKRGGGLVKQNNLFLVESLK
jgi:REP-associated tyrosine transposase